MTDSQDMIARGAQLIAEGIVLQLRQAQPGLAERVRDPRLNHATSGRIWFTTRQAADYAGCNIQTIAGACREGALHAGQPFGGAGGRWRIHRDDLDSWVAGR